MGLINFAHGELIMGGGYILVLSAALGDALRVGLVIVTTVAMAVVMERVAFRPLRGAEPDTLLVASFAVSFFLQGLAIIVFGSLPRSIGILTGVTRSIDVLGFTLRPLDLITIGSTAILLFGLVALLKKTTIGIQMRASAENFSVARLLGVQANRVIAFAFAVSGLLAGVATAIFIAQTGLVTPTMGVTPVLSAFVATIIGGLGTLVGAVLGAYALGALTVLLQVYLPDELRPFRDAFVFAALVVILVVRPQGLMGKTVRQV